MRSKRSQNYNFTAQLKAQTPGSSSSYTAVMVNDASGKMGKAVAEAVLKRENVFLVPEGLTGSPGGKTLLIDRDTPLLESDTTDPGYLGGASEKMQLHCTDEIDPVAFLQTKQSEYNNNLVVIDFTVPSVVEQMCNLYVQAKQPFVMGTTGGDRDWLAGHPAGAGVHAVVAPQMGKQVVALQAAMQQMADSFPNAFSGYKLDVVESHQSSKADTSGTAKAMVQSFNKLGVSPQVNESSIQKIREAAESQDRLGVPPAHLDGHAFHTYTLTSPDGNVQLQFKHNVCGRSIYADGSVDAALFLSQQIANNSQQYVFDMIDILKSGQML